MIKKISFNRHPVLNNINLDFSKSDNSTHNVILFVGVNGCGKTILLNELFKQIQLKEGYRFFEKYYLNNLQVQVNNEIVDYQLISHQEVNEAPEYNYQPINGPYIIDFSKYTNLLLNDNTINQLDNQSNQNFNNIEKKIVDLNNLDNQFIVNEIKKQTSVSWESLKTQTIIFRLMSAIELFFDGNIVFDKIENDKVFFKKNNISISINDLSSGEKSIIYKAVYLLTEKIGKNINAYDYDIRNAFEGGYILIDEPESNLHPQWQSKLLSFYKSLFLAADGSLKIQLFIATHSEYLVHNAISNNDLVIVFQKDPSGSVSIKRSNDIKLLFNLNSAEINYLIFHVNKTDYHIALYAYLQNLYGTTSSIARTDSAIVSDAAAIGLSIPLRPSSHGTVNYHTLSTLIRNMIDHPDGSYSYSESEIDDSIESMRSIIIYHNSHP